MTYLGWEKWRKFGAFLGGMAMILVVTSATESWENSVGMSHDAPSQLSSIPNILSSTHAHPDL